MPTAPVDDYCRKLETLIVDVLLPGYIKYCESRNIKPQLQQLPPQIKQKVKPVPALFKPY